MDANFYKMKIVDVDPLRLAPGDILVRVDPDMNRAMLIGEFRAHINVAGHTFLQVWNPTTKTYEAISEVPDAVQVLILSLEDLKTDDEAERAK